jgi:hypothetical protein
LAVLIHRECIHSPGLSTPVVPNYKKGAHPDIRFQPVLLLRLTWNICPFECFDAPEASSPSSQSRSDPDPDPDPENLFATSRIPTLLKHSSTVLLQPWLLHRPRIMRQVDQAGHGNSTAKLPHGTTPPTPAMLPPSNPNPRLRLKVREQVQVTLTLMSISRVRHRLMDLDMDMMQRGIWLFRISDQWRMGLRIGASVRCPEECWLIIDVPKMHDLGSW